MQKLRIAVWHNLPSGGAKRQVYYHVKGLLERGHYVESWCPDSADGKFLSLADIIKENVIPLGAVNGNFSAAFRPLPVVNELISVMDRHYRACAEGINNGNFDVLFANTCLYFRTTGLSKYVKYPSVLYLNEPYRWFYEALPELPWIAPSDAQKTGFSIGAIKGRLQGRAVLNGIRLQARKELEYAKGFDCILANSIFSRESILRAYNLESKVCYLGIDTDLYRPTGEEKENFVIGLGGIYPAKGVERAIRAVAAVPEQKRPSLVWIGNFAAAHYLKKCDALAKELNVKFKHLVRISDEEVVSYLSRALAIIYTPVLEPFGLAPLEANACGTVAIGIAEGGVRETIKEGENGFLARDNDPEILGGIVSRFTDREFAKKLGYQAREYVERNWNLKTCTDNIESYLTQLNAHKFAKSMNLR